MQLARSSQDREGSSNSDMKAENEIGPSQAPGHVRSAEATPPIGLSRGPSTSPYRFERRQKRPSPHPERRNPGGNRQGRPERELLLPHFHMSPNGDHSLYSKGIPHAVRVSPATIAASWGTSRATASHRVVSRARPLYPTRSRNTSGTD